MQNYSQGGEQAVILDYAPDFGIFLDIGMNDGITLSNTRALYEKGWRGVGIEPDREVFNRLKDTYPIKSGVTLFNIALGDKNEVVDFWSSGEHLGVGDTGLLSTAKQSELKRWKKESFTKEEVHMWDWDCFYNVSPHKKFDFISIDCEGLDTVILRQIDLDKTETNLVCIEYNADVNTRREI